MENSKLHPAPLTMIGVILVISSVAVNAILQNGDRYTAYYLLVGIPGVLLIVWNGPKWLHARRTSKR